MKTKPSILYVLVLLAIASCDRPVAQFRGIERDGIYNETELLDQWPEEGPELLWTFEGLGRGFASPAVTNKQIFINGEEDGNSFTAALSLAGELLWKTPNGKEFLGEGFSATYPGSRSTPTVKGKYVYAGSGTGSLACFDSKTGETIWATDLMKDLQGNLTMFGYSESPAVDEEYLYCFPGGSENNLVAFNRFSGELSWSAELLKDTFAYGSIVQIDLAEANILLGTSRYYLYTADRSNGELLAAYKLEGFQYDGEHCNTPVYQDGSIYFVGNDNPGQGAMRLQLSPDGGSISEVWRNPEVLNNFGGFVVLDGKIFTTLKGNKLVALDPNNGTISDSIKVATGSIVYADQKFICYGHNGEIQLVNYRDNKFESGGLFRISLGNGNHFAHPVINNGIMYIRRGNTLMAYKIK
ncbi:PQQ-binding-like beta-propeller repeat protein [Bacteroidota bacterium]